MKSVYIDLLCWSSAFKTIVQLRGEKIHRIYYANLSRFFEPFVGFFERTVKAPIVQITDIALGEEKLSGVSLYEIIHTRMANLLDGWGNDEGMSKSNAAFCAVNDLNPEKFAEHLKEAAYGHLYRAVEISVIAEFQTGAKPVLFIFRRTPFAGLLTKHLNDVFFYRTLFAHILAVPDRSEYVYDKFMNKSYFAGRLQLVGKFWYHWLRDLSGSLFSRNLKRSEIKPETRIGIELTQSRVRTDEINDISWLAGSGIEMDHVCGFQMEAFDADSIAVLDQYKIPRYCIFGRPANDHSLKGATTLSIQRRYLLSTALLVLGLVKCLVIWDEKGWLRFQSVRYVYRTLFWYSIYERLGVKVLWTMYDIDEDKFAKGQAIELLGGLYTGGHWSNFTICHVFNQKCFDVFFAWGEHFLRNIFNRFPYMGVFFIGYPCDYYFNDHRDRAKAIRQRYEGKFIVSYHDNMMANDLPYSKNMQLDIHKLLISLLRKFENVVVLLKPKRKHIIDEIIKELPELQEMIDLQRVEVFLGETLRSKAIPAQIGMASDLVVGLGISTAAAESFFAGTVAFHADLTGFERNEFANRGDGVVVFRDVFTLEKAVIARITGTNKWKYEDFKGYYMGLDPFMDGYASKRMGYLLKRMRDYLEQGVSREDLLPKLSRDYDIYLLSQSDWQKMNWN